MTMGSRLPAILLLTFVIIAAGLLVAGWGVAVGVGVFVGLVLGLVAILAFMAIAQRAGGSTSFSILKSASSSTEPDHAMLERHGRDFMSVAGIDAGALRRVVAVGDAVDASGVRLELTAVELREDGGLATLVAHTRPPIAPQAISSRSVSATMPKRPTSPRVRAWAVRLRPPPATRSASRRRHRRPPGS